MSRKTLGLSIESLVAFSFSTIGLVWQVLEISKVYFAFGTSVDIQIEVPRNISMPGLTVCVLLSSEKYNSSELLYLPIRELNRIGVPVANVVCQVPAPELKAIKNETSIDCDEISKPIVTLQYFRSKHKYGDRVGRCSTYFYRRYNDPPYEVFTANAKDFYQLTISPITNTSVYFFVHDPTTSIHVSEADTISMNIQQIQEMVLSTTKFTTHFLPPPYRTMCESYEDYEYGQWGCVFKCRTEKMWQKGECFLWPPDVPASPETVDSFRLRAKACSYARDDYDCFDDPCSRRQCHTEWYTTTTIYTRERTDHDASAQLFIRRPFGVEFTYNYVARLDPIEYICYVASCFGIWFGVSFADCLQYILVLIKAKLNERFSGKHRNKYDQLPGKLKRLKTVNRTIRVFPSYYYTR